MSDVGVMIVMRRNVCLHFREIVFIQITVGVAEGGAIQRLVRR
jgi:hypothetical protein